MSPLALSLRLLQAQPDARLLALASRGHEPAFEALVRRYRRPLLAYCRRLAVPDGSAEDILQQALLQAWQGLVAGREVRDARAWLYRIVHNVAVSAARRRSDLPTELAGAIDPDAVDEVVAQRLAAHDALAGLAALPELQREVMLRTAVEGRSHEEIAGALGLTSGSVRGLVYRARSTLRAAAAVLIPAPVVEWALRQHHSPAKSPAIYDALAGGGSAGAAGAVLKGGAIVTVASALAGTAAIISSPLQNHARSRVAIASPRSRAATTEPRVGPVTTVARVTAAAAPVVPASAGAEGASAPSTQHAGPAAAPGRPAATSPRRQRNDRRDRASARTASSGEDSAQRDDSGSTTTTSSGSTTTTTPSQTTGTSTIPSTYTIPTGTTTTTSGTTTSGATTTTTDG